MERPDCEVCGQPYHRHNPSGILSDMAMCPIYPTYRPKSSPHPQREGVIEERKLIIDWLRTEDHEIPAPRGITKLVARYLADFIDRGDHLRSLSSGGVEK